MLRNVFDAAFEWVEEAIDVLKRNTLLRFYARREVITNYGSVCTSTSTRRRSITLKNLILYYNVMQLKKYLTKKCVGMQQFSH